MMRLLILRFFFFCLLATLTVPLWAVSLPESFSDEATLEGLQDTVSFRFSPDGRLFIAERITGQLRIAKYDALTDTWALNASPFHTFDTPKNGGGQPQARRSGGLRDFVFDPDFANNRYVYAFYMADSSLHNRVVRIRASVADPDVAESGETLLIDLPFNDSASSGSHNGGALEFVGNDHLYITTGDGWEGDFAGDPVQSLQTYTGKVLRINKDGSIPGDNPFFMETIDDFRAIYALGLRNPYSMSKHPDTQALYINEARGSKKDRVYLLEARANYQHEGSGIGNNQSPFATAADAAGELITGGAWLPESGLGTFPETYHGRYFTALWGGNSTDTGHINTVAADDDNTVAPFASGVGLDGANGIPVKPVITRFDANGDLYYMLTTYTTSSAQIRRIRYTALETTAGVEFSPESGQYAQAIQVSLSTSTQGAQIYYTLDNTSPSPASLIYTSPFTVSASSIVRARAFKDDFNPSSETSAVYIIGDQGVNQPPNVDAGPNKTAFIGQTVSLDGSATFDPDGNDDFLTGEQWVQTAGPAVEILDATEEIAFFTASELGVYRFRLSVSDGIDQASDEVVIAVIRPARVDSGLQALYTFTEGSGAVITDDSDVAPALDLTISDPSRVSWLPDGGLRFDQATIAGNANASKIINACQSNNEISIEAWVASESTTQTGPARIVSMSDDVFDRNFTLGQDSDRYDVRLRTSGTNDNGQPSLAVPASTLEAELQHVVYSRKSNGQASIYVNGIAQITGSVNGNFSNWDSGYGLYLANELASSANNQRPWLGDMHLVAIYCNVLTATQVEQNRAAGLSPFNQPSDSDQDGVLDVIDNCPSVQNQNQLDSDKDNIGDACELQIAGADDFCLPIKTQTGAMALICL